jgi:aminomethyltransferase
MNEQGGIKDDTIITKITDRNYYMVVNGACKNKDLEHMHNVLVDEFAHKDVDIIVPEGLSLVAVQGPKAMHIIEQILETDLKMMNFMTMT